MSFHWFLVVMLDKISADLRVLFWALIPCSHMLIFQLILQARYRRYTSQTYENVTKLVGLLSYSLPCLCTTICACVTRTCCTSTRRRVTGARISHTRICWACLVGRVGRSSTHSRGVRVPSG